HLRSFWQIKSPDAARKAITVLRIVFVASLLWGLTWCCFPLLARPQLEGAPSSRMSTPTHHKCPASVSTKELPPCNAVNRKAWRKWMERNPPPKKGCFKATYPKMKWEQVPCGPPSPYPNGPAPQK